MHKIPYYSQEKNWTCGPAAMRMVLSSMGIKKTEKELIRLMDTNKQRGTKHKAFSALAEYLKLNYIVQRNATINDLRKVLRLGYYVILCYFDPKRNVGHYAILKRLGLRFIYILDPTPPPEKFSLPYFKSIWFSRDDKEKGWFIGLKK